jgi:hypothetical protein
VFLIAAFGVVLAGVAVVGGGAWTLVAMLAYNRTKGWSCAGG